MASHSVNVMIKARDEASKKFGKIGRSAGSMGKMFRTAAAAAGAYFGIRAIKNFTAESIRAFGVQETAVRHLTDALANVGAGGAAAMMDMQAFASQLQQLTTIGDETTLEIMSLGASMGNMSGQTLKAATTAAIGFSKSLGMDVKAAMTLVAKAAQGNTQSFTRYGIQLDETMTDQEKFQEILTRGADGFKIAQGETETFTGKMAQLSNTWGDFKETIGEALATYLPGITESFQVVQVAIENWRLVMDIAMKSAKLNLIDFWEDVKHFFGVTIPDLLSWFGRNWKKIFTDLWHATKAIFVNMFENAKNFFTALWSWIKGDGFDFEWTGLLDGFEATLEEMPTIAARAMTATEKALAGQIADLREKFGQKLADKLNVNLDTTGMVAAAAMPGAASTDTAVAAAAGGSGPAVGRGVAARESRLLTLRAGAQFSPGERAMVDSDRKQEKLLERVAKATERLTALGFSTAAAQGAVQLSLSNMT